MPDRADHSRTVLYWLREQVDTPDDWGVIAAGAPDTLPMLRTESLQGQRRTARSEIRKQTRRAGPLRAVGQDTQGNLDIEVPAQAQFEALLEAAFAETWSTPLAISEITIDFVASDNSINDSAAGFVTAGVTANTWIEVRGSVDNDGRYFVTSVAAGKLVVAYGTITDEVAGATVAIVGSYLRDGTKFISQSVERHRPDFNAGDRYTMYRGQVLNSFDLNLTFEQIVTASLGFVGLAPDQHTAATGFGAAATAAPAIEDLLMDVSNNMRAFREDGLLNGNIRSLNFNLTQGVSLLPAAQQLNPVGVSFGTKACSGTLEGYLEEDDPRPDKGYLFQPVRWDFELNPDDPDDGPSYIFTLFRAKLTSMGDPPKDAVEGPVIPSYGFECEEDPGTGQYIQVSRIPPTTP